MTAIFRVYQDGRFPQKVCPCVILVHSQGGNFRFNAALKAPDKVKALIAIEPSGAPDVAQSDVAKSKDVPSDQVGRLHVESCGAATPHGRPGYVEMTATSWHARGSPRVTLDTGGCIGIDRAWRLAGHRSRLVPTSPETKAEVGCARSSPYREAADILDAPK
jgi:pimeloyl-ACP methyl ester carboxylesterase